VSVQVTDQQSGPIVPERHDARRDQADTSCSKSVLQGWQIVDLEREPRRRDVVAGQRRGPSSRGAGRSIAEQFKMRRAFRLRMKCCHLDHRTRDGIKLFLLRAAIEREPGDGKSQHLPVERDACRRAGNDDGGMIDPKAWRVSMRSAPPARRRVVGREREQFERMPLRITKLELSDSA
jgi:hypothetical protein